MSVCNSSTERFVIMNKYFYQNPLRMKQAFKSLIHYKVTLWTRKSDISTRPLMFTYTPHHSYIPTPFTGDRDSEPTTNLHISGLVIPDFLQFFLVVSDGLLPLHHTR